MSEVNGGSERVLPAYSVEGEKKRANLAPTFDRLIDANLELTLAVGRLVRVSYVMLFVYAVGTVLAVLK